MRGDKRKPLRSSSARMSEGRAAEVSSVPPTTINSKEYFDREVKLYEIYRDYIKATSFETLERLRFYNSGSFIHRHRSYPKNRTGRACASRPDKFLFSINYCRGRLLTCLHMLFRDSYMHRTMRGIDKRISKIKKVRTVPVELDNFAKENAHWLHYFSKWHYKR